MPPKRRITDRVDWEFIRSWKCGVLVTLLVAIPVVFAIFQVACPPPQQGTSEKSTPSFLQSRGVNWHVFIEDPISFDEVQPLMVVFTEQVNNLFKIRTYVILYESIEDDEVENYSSAYSGRVYGAFEAPARGPVEIPVYFLTGYGWSWDPPRKFPAWAYPTPQYFEKPSDLHFRIVMARDTERPDYVGLSANREDNLLVMIHEFGHNMGLRDLYLGGDVEGCSDLPVVMSTLLSLDAEYEYYDSPPKYERLVMNRTTGISPGSDQGEPITVISVEEAYLENNTLYFVSYNIISNRSGVKRLSNSHVCIYDLSQLEDNWTREEAAFIGMNGQFPLSCPQEFR